MVLTESEIEETALDLLRDLNGYQVAYGPDLDNGRYVHRPSVRAGSMRAGSVRVGAVGAGLEPAPTETIFWLRGLSPYGDRIP